MLSGVRFMVHWDDGAEKKRVNFSLQQSSKIQSVYVYKTDKCVRKWIGCEYSLDTLKNRPESY